jgi:hypothetical protein
MKRWLGIPLSTAALVLAVAPAAHAAFLMTPQIDFATDPIQVGSSGTGTLAFSNDSTTNVTATPINEIVLEPSCRLPGETPPCTNREPGIFSISSGTGVTGTSCAGITFNVTTGIAPFAGSLEFIPQSAIPPMLPNATCAINFTYTALAVPTFDTQGEDGIQTDQLAEVRAEPNGGGPTQFGPGTGDTTINPAPPATNQQPPPAATPAPAPTAKKCKKKRKTAFIAKKCRKKK